MPAESDRRLTLAGHRRPEVGKKVAQSDKSGMQKKNRLQWVTETAGGHAMCESGVTGIQPADAEKKGAG